MNIKKEIYLILQDEYHYTDNYDECYIYQLNPINNDDDTIISNIDS